MVEYASGSLKISGLSGTDTDFQEMIDKLYAIESRQANQLLKWKADWETRLESFQQIRSEMLNLQTSLMSMNSLDKFLVKLATSSEEDYVSATAGAKALDGTYTVEVNKLAEQYAWSRNTHIYSGNDVICDDVAGGTFAYRYAGKVRRLHISKGTTLQALQNMINNDAQNPGVRAQLITGQDGIVFQLQGKSTGSSNSLIINDTTNLTCFGGNISLYDEKYREEQNSMTLLGTTFADDSGSQIVNPDAVARTFTFTVDGKRKTFSVDPGATLQDLMDDINLWGANNVAGCKAPSGANDGLGGNGEDLAKLEYNGTDWNFVLSKRDTYFGAGKYNTEMLDVMDARYTTTMDQLFTTGPARDYTVHVFPTGSDVADTVTVTLNAGDTLQDLSAQLNAQLGAYNTSTQIIADPDGGVRLSVAPTANDDMWNDVLSQTFADDQAFIENTTAAAKVFSLRIGNSETSPQPNQVLKITMAAGEKYTVRDFVNAVNSGLGPMGKARLVSGAGGVGFNIVVDTNTTTSRVTIEDGTLDMFKYEMPKESSGEWQIQQGGNAEIKVNGWPAGTEYLEVASNNIAAGTVIEGIGLTLRGVGTSVITVANDTPKLTENVEKFVESVNSLRTVLLSLTTFDEEKQQLDPDYAESQFEMQRGSVLTGNYGIQMLTSMLKTAVGSSSLGFQHLSTDALGVVTGDFFTSLSQIGITTNATKGHANYGLLEINGVDGKGGQKSLAQALNENPEAVARLFAVYGEGVSNNQDLFQFRNAVDGIAKPGTYDVKYTVAIDPLTTDPYIDTAFINGKKANIDNVNRIITLTTSGDPASSIAIDIYNMAPGVDHVGSVSIKEGKVNELLGMMDGTEGLLGSGGTLQNLEKNYRTVIDNIEKKIKSEDDRLVKWRETMDLKFARLEAVLARYNSMNEGLQAQLTQLNSNKK